jgi:ubiquinone/menaquinone biosynthesis C-methylase UbiE
MRRKNMPKRIAHKEEAITGAEESQRYGETHRKHAKLIYKASLKYIHALQISGHYLEVGAGTGILATMVAEANPNITITAIDLSPDMVAVAKGNIEENNLQDRIHCAVADVNDATAMEELGAFDLVYSAFSLHHWEDPKKSLSNLWNALKTDGVFYIYDLKRVWWLYFFPLYGGFAESMRASYMPKEIGSFFDELGIKNHTITTVFPFFMQSVTAWK